MSEAKKPAKNAKKTGAKPDIEQPGKSAPAPTSKPVIVTHRPIMKDPMMVEDDEPAEKVAKEDLAHTAGPKLEPLTKPAEEPKTEPKAASDEKPTVESPAEEDKQAEPAPPQPSEPSKSEPEKPTEPERPETQTAAASGSPTDEEKPPAGKPGSQDTPGPDQKSDAEAARKKEQAKAIEKLVASGKYELPINAVEKRKARHFVILGFLLAILLALAWADIALDAGLIKVNGINPVTHFFSN
jgi:hypothetical protein